MNDDMALGAIQAIEAAGLKPAKDIIIVSVDGVKGIFQAMIEGKSNATVECNPLQGDLFFSTAEKILKGESVPKSVFVEEGVFPADTAKDVLRTSVEDLLSRTDLEEETIVQVQRILRKEFDEE